MLVEVNKEGMTDEEREEMMEHAVENQPTED